MEEWVAKVIEYVVVYIECLTLRNCFLSASTVKNEETYSDNVKENNVVEYRLQKICR